MMSSGSLLPSGKVGEGKGYREGAAFFNPDEIAVIERHVVRP
jgi:hypothetical protein